MKKIFLHTIVGLLLLPVFSSAQSIAVNDNALSAKYPFVTAVFNRIFNNSGLDSFYQKLATLKKIKKGVVSVVHIGDSHIQPDFLTGEVRNGLQGFFGNAGRGLVFPYQLAQSNAPSDVSSSSAIRWQFNRVAHPEIPISYGISGYGISSNNAGATINFFLRPGGSGIQTFKRLKFFTGNSSASWMVQADNNDVPYVIKKEETDTALYQEVNLEYKSAGFSIVPLPSDAVKSFYGVSLENDSAGVLYHSIGVNGARYDQYNIATIFWQQLPALKADLYIVSLGTNEAQRAGFPESVFLQGLSLFIEKLKQASPGASVLITTAPDSYKGRTSNKVLQQLNNSITNYCNKNYIPLWDMYRITNGYGSAYSWARRGLMSRDRIHFTADGYRLQGNLLWNALAKGYNDYTGSY
jgi:lysophospholipase L1-like esterase